MCPRWWRSGSSRPRPTKKDDCGVLAFRAAQMLEDLGRYEEAAQAYQDVRKHSHDGRVIARRGERKGFEQSLVKDGADPVKRALSLPTKGGVMRV